jgi:hypothetical protein
MPAAHPTPKPYLLLFRNTGAENFAHLSPDRREQLVAQWNSWYDELVQKGKAVEGQPLESDSRVVSGGVGGARVIDGPFAEAKEAVGGFVKLMVSGIEEATEIARQHPALAYGMKIEVRPMTMHCHLGVCARGKEPANAAAPAQ